MSNRRSFIRKSSLGALSFLFSKNNFSEWGESKTEIKNKPIVLSTWRHGIAANEVAWKILNSGGNALDAVEAGVSVTESDLTNQTVGLGGLPDRDGFVTLDACIMDHDCRCGSVAFLQHIEHPIQVARKVMDQSPHVMLAGEGAYQFALKNGFSRSNAEVPTDKSKKRYLEWLKESKYKPEANIENHDTIGMIALDENGKISGACTTSGLAFKMHGRVGDSPIIGAGLYVDGEVGAAVATGVGEMVMRIAGTHTVVELMRNGASPQEACEETIRRIIRKHSEIKNKQVGLLALNTKGEYGAYGLTSGFTYSLYNKDGNRVLDSRFAVG
ncbi:MAG: glycosylasparaginase [Bacteroidetes bacterium]|nr:glycosylasparaginase [Bacteroidota bacterium]